MSLDGSHWVLSLRGDDDIGGMRRRSANQDFVRFSVILNIVVQPSMTYRVRWTPIGNDCPSAMYEVGGNTSAPAALSTVPRLIPPRFSM